MDKVSLSDSIFILIAQILIISLTILHCLVIKVLLQKLLLLINRVIALIKTILLSLYGFFFSYSFAIYHNKKNRNTGVSKHHILVARLRVNKSRENNIQLQEHTKSQHISMIISLFLEQCLYMSYSHIVQMQYKRLYFINFNSNSYPYLVNGKVGYRNRYQGIFFGSSNRVIFNELATTVIQIEIRQPITKKTILQSSTYSLRSGTSKCKQKRKKKEKSSIAPIPLKISPKTDSSLQ